MSDNEKHSLLAELIKLAKADGNIREVEFRFLLSIAAQMGVTKDDFKSLFEEYIEFNPPKMEAERIIQFQRLILLMNVDLNIDQSELDYIKDLGIRMGLHPSATNRVLEEMHKHPNKIIPPATLIDIFKTYHN